MINPPHKEACRWKMVILCDPNDSSARSSFGDSGSTYEPIRSHVAPIRSTCWCLWVPGRADLGLHQPICIDAGKTWGNQEQFSARLSLPVAEFSSMGFARLYVMPLRLSVSRAGMCDLNAHQFFDSRWVSQLLQGLLCCCWIPTTQCWFSFCFGKDEAGLAHV